MIAITLWSQLAAQKRTSSIRRLNFLRHNPDPSTNYREIAVTEPKYLVPEAIRVAAKHGELVVFVGAGVSVLCGSPTWEGFANAVIDAIEEPARLSFLEVEQLRAIQDPRRRLSIAMDLAEGANVNLGYEEILHPKGGKDLGLETYRLLSALNPVFITTNYDKWFDHAPPPSLSGGAGAPSEPVAPRQRMLVVGPDQFSTDLLFDRGAVFHLHGRCTEPRSMVISLRQYISHYSNPRVIAFLQEVFSKWTVLFVGYGLAELEILEYVIRAGAASKGSFARLPHYILYPYRSSEAAQTRFIERYFEKQCNVGVIKYPIDENGWGELRNVLREWQPQIDVRDASTIEKQTYLDRQIEEEDSAARRSSAIRLVLRHPDLQPYFFNRIASPIWLDDLYDEGLLNPASSSPPTPEESTSMPTTHVAPRWPPGAYLERIASHVAGPQAEKVMSVVRACTDDAERKGIDNWVTNWNLAQTFSRLEIDALRDDDARLVRTWLGGNFNADMIVRTIGLELLPRLLASGGPKERVITLDLIALLTAASANSGSRGRRRAVTGDYWIRETLHASANEIGRRFGEDGVLALCESLKAAIGTPEDDARSYWRRSAIEDHEQDRHHDDLQNTLIDAVRDASLGCLAVDPSSGRRLVETLLQESHPTLVRIGIHLCGERFGDVGDLFWTEFRPSWFGDTAYWHEVYWYLRKGFSRFTGLQRQRYLDEVEGFRGDWADEGRSEEFDARHRIDLLHPAKGLGDRDVDERYARLVAEHGVPREHVDFHFYSSAGWVGDESPIELAELREKTAAQLLGFLREFEPSNGWDQPTRRGLASTLSELVRADEEAFATRLGPFVEMLPVYQHGVIKGLAGRWRDKKSIDWAASLAFASAVLAKPGFFRAEVSDDAGSDEPDTRWVTGDILDLISVGISDDDRAMPRDLLPQALQIAKTVIEALPPKPADDADDAVSRAINNPRGRAIELVIRLLLHASRSASEATSPAIGWEQVSDLFDRELVSSEAGRNADFAAHAGTYIANLHYLAPTWVEENFDRLFSTTNDEAWSCAAQGFAYQRYSYDWLYQRLRGGGHLARMLADEELPDSVGEKALQFIMLAYLGGREPLEGEGSELIQGILRELRPEVISQLCWFVWTLHGDLDDEARARVRDLWLAASARIVGDEASHAVALSNLNLLASALTNLDDQITDAWKQAAPYADDAHHAPHMVKDFARIAPTHPRPVAEIFLAALDRFVPTYDEEDIVSCVKTIAHAGQRDLAETICQTYADKGSTMLNETYREIRS